MKRIDNGNVMEQLTSLKYFFLISIFYLKMLLVTENLQVFKDIQRCSEQNVIFKKIQVKKFIVSYSYRLLVYNFRNTSPLLHIFRGFYKYFNQFLSFKCL